MVKSAGFMQDWLPCTHTDTHTHYTPYPDFQFLPDESQGVSKHKVQQIKEEKLRANREAISTGGLKTVQKYFISLPAEQAASFCQRIHPLILNKISELRSVIRHQ